MRHDYKWSRGLWQTEIVSRVDDVHVHEGDLAKYEQVHSLYFCPFEINVKIIRVITFLAEMTS